MHIDFVSIMNEWGYLGVFFLIILENVFPPIPSEGILLFAGALTASATGGNLSFLWVMVIATFSSVVGAIFLYYVGLWIGLERIRSWTDTRLGRLLRLKKKDIDNAHRWFDEKGPMTVLICRCIPVLRSLISIPAGINRMKIDKFVIYTVIGSTVWNLLFIGLGRYFGSNWKTLVSGIDRFQDVFKVLIVITSVAGLVWWFRFRQKKRRLNPKLQNNQINGEESVSSDREND